MSIPITFVTHLKYDSWDRISNFQTILNYFSTNLPNSKFVVVEDDAQHDKRFDQIKFPKNLTKYFLNKNSGQYHRTKCLNFGFKQASTEVVVSLDTDCVVPIDAIQECAQQLLDDATIAWPHSGCFLDVSPQVKLFFESQNMSYNSLFERIPKYRDLEIGKVYGNCACRSKPGTGHVSVGGIVMFNRTRLFEIGGYHEKYVGWGSEDNELAVRCKILNKKAVRPTGPAEKNIIFHFFHSNAAREENPFITQNRNETKFIQTLNEKQLLEYIETWPWKQSLLK